MNWAQAPTLLKVRLLAISILNDILHRGGKIIATTHYSELKSVCV